MYEHLSFFDQYGSSFIVFLLITIVIVLFYIYFKVLSNSQEIKDDWINQRCKPTVLPFAGLINKPTNKTSFEFTAENFNYCLNNMLTASTGQYVQPITYISNVLQNLFLSISDSLNKIRQMMANIRTNMQNVTEEIMGRALNVAIPIQNIMIAFKDVMGKVQGVFTASLYSSIGVYYTLKSSLGAVVNSVVLIVILLIAMIVPLLANPFTTSIALPMIATLTAIVVPLSILLVVLSKTLGITPLQKIPKICFDENTLFLTKNKQRIRIADIQVGTVLNNGSIITAKMCFESKGADMHVFLSNPPITVSGSHRVWYPATNEWLLVRDHPQAMLLEDYSNQRNNPCIYCLNTNTKIIELNGVIFSDWDDLYEFPMLYANICQKNLKVKTVRDIHLYNDAGFSGNTQIEMHNGEKKELDKIKCGDVLKGGIKVLSLVEIQTLSDFYHCFESFNIQTNYLSHFLETITGNFERIPLSETKLPKNEKIIYHLLTEQGHFYLNTDLIVKDYNSLIENYL